MIEQKIEALTLAIAALTAAITGAAGAAPAAAADKPKTSEKPAGDKPAGGKKGGSAEKTGPKHSRSEVNAALNEVKENFDTAAAKAIIKGAGFDKMADITEDKFDAVFDACKEKMAELGGDGSGDDDGM